MTPNQNNILAKLKLSGRLPTPKGVALEVINLTQREDASNHDIVRLISADPALSVRVIKAANVLLASSSRPIVTISDAVTVLGSRALRQLVLGIALIVDHQHGPCKQFNYAYFWAHSLLTGIYVRHLAALSRLAAEEEIFVIGLLGGSDSWRWRLSTRMSSATCSLYLNVNLWKNSIVKSASSSVSSRPS